MEIASNYHTLEPDSFNIVADLPGTDLADEVVMLGAHFDSLHGGTGATDDAAGCAVILDAMRISAGLERQDAPDNSSRALDRRRTGQPGRAMVCHAQPG